MRVLTRRDFVAATAAVGAAMVGCRTHSGNPWEFFSDAQAASLAAICDQLIPSDDYPSASEAGVVTYIDRQLMRHFRRHRPTYEAGLNQADGLSRARCGVPLSEAPQSIRQQVVKLLEQDNPQFFSLVCDHAMQGFYGSPRHGGNRDAVSWRMLGLDEPPLRGRAQIDAAKGTPS